MVVSTAIDSLSLAISMTGAQHGSAGIGRFESRASSNRNTLGGSRNDRPEPNGHAAGSWPP